MSFRDDNAAYETWLAQQCDVVKKDIARKHKKMRQDAFLFLRATYFRWARKIGDWCPEVMNAPRLLAIGDVHLENFGTWRDGDGRFVWGINDFDEAAVMPYTLDLLRLAASVRLRGGVNNRAAAASILGGYADGLEDPKPAVLDEGALAMRRYAISTDKKCRDFWTKVAAYPVAKPPRAVVTALKASLPKGATDIRYCSRVAGSGGLGQPRYVAVAQYRGGTVVREAKALVPSAWYWAHGQTHAPSRLLDLADGRYRAPDPFFAIHGDFIYRRIAVDSQKIELTAQDDVDATLLRAMGAELGAVHSNSPTKVAAIQTDLKKRRDDWLYNAAKKSAARTARDFDEWRGRKPRKR